MDLDPHTLQQILSRIHQQMRCPQCGQRVPVEFPSVQVVGDDAMLLQLKCETCNAYIVLQASFKGIENLSAAPYDEDLTANISTTLRMPDEDLSEIRKRLADSDGSFSKMFATEDATTGDA